MSQSKLWETIEVIVKQEGLELFDLEIPAGRAGTLKVYISRPQDGAEVKNAGVQLQNCTSVAKKILELPNIEEILPGEHLIEVSSPGINRKLSRPEHFRGAVGERVRLKIRDDEGKHKVVFGKLLAYSADKLAYEDEGSHGKCEVPLSEIQQARVDFAFD